MKKVTGAVEGTREWANELNLFSFNIFDSLALTRPIFIPLIPPPTLNLCYPHLTSGLWFAAA